MIRNFKTYLDRELYKQTELSFYTEELDDGSFIVIYNNIIRFDIPYSTVVNIDLRELSALVRYMINTTSSQLFKDVKIEVVTDAILH